MPRTQSLTFISKDSLLQPRVENEHKNILWNQSKSGFSKGFNFSWDNEDYRQNNVQGDLGLAIPNEEDFLPFPFRHISATTVGGGTWKATEFPEKVLKKSTPMLAFKPSYVNHNLEVGNIIGAVGLTKWSNGYTMSDGTKVPPGIDAPIWIDGKMHTDLCRKLAAFPVPHIQSVSVTVVFEWEPSHVFEDRNGQEDLWLFEMRIGQTVDGEMVRRIATNIIEYYETSLVWLGADPFAKILDADGKPLNIEKSAIVGMKKFDEDPLQQLYKDTGRYFVQESCISNGNKLDLFKGMLQINGDSGKSKPKTTITKNNRTLNNNIQFNDDNMDLVNYLATRLNKKPEEITEDFLSSMAIVPKAEHTSLKALADKAESVDNFDKIVGERDQYKSDLEAEKAQTETNKPLVDFANSTLESEKENVLKFYRLTLKGEKEDPKAVELIERAANEKDFEALRTLTKQYGGTVINEFEPTCKSCGSTDVTFRSTEESDGNMPQDDFLAPDLAGEFRL